MSTAESRALARAEESIANLTARQEAMETAFNEMRAVNEAMAEAMRDALGSVDKVRERVKDLGADISSHIATSFKELEDKVAELSVKIEGRNKSAPIKRNMTDKDAMDVLQGAYAEMDHKTAAAASGLTYAQVYSARGGFTFKHVIHDLEKAGWKNPWEKPKSAKK